MNWKPFWFVRVDRGAVVSGAPPHQMQACWESGAPCAHWSAPVDGTHETGISFSSFPWMKEQDRSNGSRTGAALIGMAAPGLQIM